MIIGLIIRSNHVMRLAVTVDKTIVDPGKEDLRGGYWLTNIPECTDDDSVVSWSGVINDVFRLSAITTIAEARIALKKLESAIPEEFLVKGRPVERALRYRLIDEYAGSILPPMVVQKFTTKVVWSPVEAGRLKKDVMLSDNRACDLDNMALFLPEVQEYRVIPTIQSDKKYRRLGLVEAIIRQDDDVIASGWMTTLQYEALSKQATSHSVNAAIEFTGQPIPLSKHPVMSTFAALEGKVECVNDYRRMVRTFLMNLRDRNGQLTLIALLIRGQRAAAAFQLGMELAQSGYTVNEINYDRITTASEDEGAL